MGDHITEEEFATLRLKSRAMEGSRSEVADTSTVHYTISAEADFTLKLTRRYRKVVEDLILGITTFYHQVYPAQQYYDFQPVLVAEAVDASVFDRLHRRVGNYFVEMNVQSGKLYITDLSIGDARSVGVADLTAQASVWSHTSGFSIMQRHICANGLNAYSPGVVVTVRPNFRAPAAPEFSRAAIIELEVSNRSITSMRRDFIRYFEEAAVCSVVVIKMFPEDCHSPCQRAVAVHYTRLPGQNVIEVVNVCDFGILPISPLAAALFEEELLPAQGPSLPPVSRHLWGQNRHIPVLAAALSDVDCAGAQYVRAVERYVHDLLPMQYTSALYGGVMPTIRIDGMMLRSILHNLPHDWPEYTDDLVLDLGSLFYTVHTSILPRPKVSSLIED